MKIFWDNIIRVLLNLAYRPLRSTRIATAYQTKVQNKSPKLNTELWLGRIQCLQLEGWGGVILGATGSILVRVWNQAKFMVQCIHIVFKNFGWLEVLLGWKFQNFNLHVGGVKRKILPKRQIDSEFVCRVTNKITRVGHFHVFIPSLLKWPWTIALACHWNKKIAITRPIGPKCKK